MPYKKNNLLVYNFGEKGSDVKPRPSIIQDYVELKKQCLSMGSLFEDPLLPTVDSSLFYTKKKLPKISWKRPGEICDNPKFFVNGASRFDIKQGGIGDCWLAVAMAILPSNHEAFHLVVPDGQSFAENYAGIFHFRFWRYGCWVDVVIDDRLPTYDKDKKLVFLHSSDKNEFWSALLQKAYAKIYGSYEALEVGSNVESLADFTGGICENFILRFEVPDNLYTIMLKAYENSSLMACTTPNVAQHAGIEKEKRTPQGLSPGHAYSVTKVQYVEVDTPTLSGRFPLIRIRNPWGEVEWNGAWSDEWPEWEYVSEKTKREIGMKTKVDGEFWIEYTDFLKYFCTLCICCLHPDALNPDIYKDDDKNVWKLYTFQGEWVRGSTAGGCIIHLETYWRNPQYKIKLADNFQNDYENRCTVIIGLMQKHRRSQRHFGVENLKIGFELFYLEDPENLPKPLDLNFFKKTLSVKAARYIHSREVSHRFQLLPGEYCIVPSTAFVNQEGEFLLRVFTKTEVNMEEYDEEFEIILPAHIKAHEPEVEKVQMISTKTYAKFANGKEIDWAELKEILDDEIGRNAEDGGTGILSKLLNWFPSVSIFEADGGFSKEICRSFIAMMDTDRSCKLSLQEFIRLFNIIQEWKAVFESYDYTKTGYLQPFSLKEALKSAGFKLNNQVLNALCHRYASKDGRIEFDDFLLCAVKLETLIENFKNKDPNSTNEVKFTLEEWVTNIIHF